MPLKHIPVYLINLQKKDFYYIPLELIKGYKTG